MTHFISTMQTGAKYRVCCLSQQGMQLKIALPSLTHYSDGHSVEISLKAILKYPILLVKGFAAYFL